MSSTIASPTKLALEDYRQTWAQATADVLSQIAGLPFRTRVSAMEGPCPQKPDSISYFCLSMGDPLSGEQALSVSAADALALSQLLMGEPLNGGGSLDADHRDALAELVRQIAGSAGLALGTRLGEGVEVKLIGAVQPSWLTPSSTGFTVQLSSSDSLTVAVHMQLSPDLSVSVTPLEASGADTPTRGQSSPTHREPNFEFLKDIELSVTLRFGKRNVLLNDILEISPGTVLELDQQVQEPVELLVGKKVIARGEVVVVEGNYGLRVTEVVSPVERIESLRD